MGNYLDAFKDLDDKLKQIQVEMEEELKQNDLET